MHTNKTKKTIGAASCHALAAMICGAALLAGAQGARGADTTPQPRGDKRGISYNSLTPEQARQLAKGVSWMYNWHYDTTEALKSKTSGIAYYPMVWGNGKESIEGFKRIAESDFQPEFVLAINEPNLKEQAFITPKETADAYARIRKIAAQKNIRVIGPHMALGSAPNSSITAFDPIEKKDVTYTYMVPFLDAFMRFAKEADSDVEAVAVHSYGDIHELKWMIGMLHEKYGKPIWVTEFNWWNSKDADRALDYMIEAVDFFERSPYVAKYAWFKADMRDEKNSLIGADGNLTRLGEFYANMPAARPNHNFALPGKIAAAACHELRDAKVVKRLDAAPFVDAQTTKAGGGADFKVEIKDTATRTFTIAYSGAATVSVFADGVKVLEMPLNSNGSKQYAEHSTPLKLEAGARALRVTASSEAFRISEISWQ